MYKSHVDEMIFDLANAIQKASEFDRMISLPNCNECGKIKEECCLSDVKQIAAPKETAEGEAYPKKDQKEKHGRICGTRYVSTVKG